MPAYLTGYLTASMNGIEAVNVQDMPVYLTSHLVNVQDVPGQWRLADRAVGRLVDRWMGQQTG